MLSGLCSLLPIEEPGSSQEMAGIRNGPNLSCAVSLITRGIVQSELACHVPHSSTRANVFLQWRLPVEREDEHGDRTALGQRRGRDHRRPWAGVAHQAAGLHWEPPGGVLELDESIEAGLRREVREETGLTVEPVALTGVYKNMARGIFALVFRCNMICGHLTLNDEVPEFQWATPEEVKAMAD